MVDTGALKLDIKVVKCLNPFFSLNTFLQIIEISRLQKLCWPYRHPNDDTEFVINNSNYHI